MKTILMALVALTTLAASATAQNEKSPELKVLDRFVGTWDVQVTVKPAGGEESTFSVTSTRTWSQRGTFIYFDDPNFERPHEPEFQMLLTYDPEARNYPGVMMTGPSRCEITGTWDERAQKMTFTGILANGNRFVSSHRFIDEDNAEPSGVIKNAAGEVVLELSWKQTRRPNEPEAQAARRSAVEGLSSEQRVIDRFVGAWDVQATAKPAGGEETSFSSTLTGMWSQRGTFYHSDDPNFERPQKPEIQTLLTYDPDARNYPGVMMMGPSRCEITGTWDERSRTMTFTGILANGNRLVSSHRFIDEDNAAPRVVIKNPAGDVVLELEREQTRRPDEPLPPEPTVDEVLSSYIEAIGGIDANKKHATRKIEGTMTLPGAPGPNKMTFIAKAPSFNHMRIEIPGFGVTSTGCDGKIAWTDDPREGTVQLEGEKLKAKLRDSNYYRLLDLKSEFETLAYEGREKLHGNTYDVVKGTGENDYQEFFYFDARTHLLNVIKRPEVSVRISDYRKVQGVRIPFSTVIVATVKEVVFSMTMKFEHVKFGDQMDDGLFAMPKR